MLNSNNAQLPCMLGNCGLCMMGTIPGMWGFCPLAIGTIPLLPPIIPFGTC